MIPSLKSVFGSRTKALEILYLINDLKPVVRQGFYDEELPLVRDFCKKKHLFLEYSTYKVVPADSTFYSNKGIKVPREDSRRGMSFVYISKNIDKAVMANVYEMKNDHRSLGKILGYPACCVDFYVKHEPERRNIDADLISCTLNNSKGVRYPFWTNISKRAMDFTLINHFPCSFNCLNSIAQAQQHLHLLSQIDTNLAMKMSSELKCRVAIGNRYVEFN